MLEILIKILPLFLFMGIGVIIKKRNIISADGIGDLSKIIVYVTFPPLIINSITTSFSIESLKDSFVLIIIGIIYYSLIITYSKILSKKVDKENSGTYVFLSTFANTGYMGFPVIFLVFANKGIYYTAIYNIAHMMFFWGIGIHLISKVGKVSWKNFLNPGIMSILISFFIIVINIDLPPVLRETLKNLGGMTTPLSMILIGAICATIEIKHFFEKKVLILTFFKMFLVPTIVFFMTSFLPVSILVRTVIIVISAMPCSVNSVIIARKYNADYQFAARAVMMTTLTSILTIPIIIFLLEKYIII